MQSIRLFVLLGEHRIQFVSFLDKNLSVRDHTLAVALLAALFSISVAKSQVQPSNPDSALTHVLEQMTGQPLTLHDGIELALKNATAVRIAEATWQAARGAEQREAGAFDPELFFNLNYLDQTQPAASFFSGAPILTTTQTTSSSGLRWNLPIGTKLEASVNTIRLNTNSAFAFLNPQYTAFGNITLRQSLLGGFFVSAQKNLSRTEEEATAAKARYDQAVLAIRTQVEQSYWDLYAAERDYAVQKLTRDRGEAFLRETELRAKTGLVGPNHVAIARTFLAEQEIFLLDREEQLNRFSDQFASLIGTRPGDTTHRFLAKDNPPETFPVEDAGMMVQQALEHNLDLRAAEADAEARRTLARASLWESLPTVNLVGSIGGSGLSGEPRDVIFGDDTLRTTRSGSLEDAIHQSINRDYPSWSVGIEVNIPILLRSGRGEHDRLAAEVTIAEQRVVQQKRMLEDQVRSSHRELSHGQARLKAAREGVAAAQEQVRIGLIEYQNGRTTAFELVRLSQDFAVAQQRYSQALVRNAKAAASLRQLTSGAYTGGAAP